MFLDQVVLLQPTHYLFKRSSYEIMLAIYVLHNKTRAERLKKTPFFLESNKYEKLNSVMKKKGFSNIKPFNPMS